jgi:hypothetical protein
VREETKSCFYCGEVVLGGALECAQCHRVSPESRWEYGRFRYVTPKRHGLVVAAWLCFFSAFLPWGFIPRGDVLMPMVLLAGFGIGVILRNSGDASARRHGAFVQAFLAVVVVLATVGHHLFMK